MKVRIQKHIRDITGMSRRKIENLIKEGRVTANGKTAVIGEKVDNTGTKILIDNKSIESPSNEKTYILFNKPQGCITSRSDPHHDKTIYDYLPEDFKRLFPVGRLDKDTEGLLILTDDGDFAFKMTHPRHEVEKEYYVELDGTLTKKQINMIEQGLKTPEIITSIAKITNYSESRDKSLSSLHITIHEGQNREIKRIFNTFGLKVTYLKRLRFNDFILDDLKKGSWKKLHIEKH